MTITRITGCGKSWLRPRMWVFPVVQNHYSQFNSRPEHAVRDLFFAHLLKLIFSAACKAALIRLPFGTAEAVPYKDLPNWRAGEPELARELRSQQPKIFDIFGGTIAVLVAPASLRQFFSTRPAPTANADPST